MTFEDPRPGAAESSIVGRTFCGTGSLSRWVVPTLVAAGCLVAASTQALGTSRDYPEYDAFWNALRDGGLSFALASRYEPGFVYLSWVLIAALASNQALYGTLAALSAFLKTVAVQRLVRSTESVAVAGVFYAFRLLPLQEFTQVRGSVALALLVAALALRWSGHRSTALAVSCMAPFFHISTIVMIPFLSFSFSRRRHLLLLMLGVFLLVRLVLPLVIQRLSEEYGIVALYELEDFSPPNPFSAVVLLDLFVIAFGVALWQRQTPLMKHVLLLECVGVSLFWATLTQPVLAHRFREAFSTFWVFYVAAAYDEGGELRAASIMFTIASSIGHLFLYWLNPAEPYFS